MKQSLIYATALFLTLTACRKDDDTTTTTTEVAEVSTQNTNDDAAIQKYLDEHYFDAQGKVVAFSSTTTSDDNYTKLANLNPQKLASGVVVIVRDGAQPTAGTEIGETDVLRLMQKTTAFLSTEAGAYSSEINFSNSVENTGTLDIDPIYYYVKESILSSTGNARSYYEIEGLKEGMKYFQSFDKADSENYNLQGVIIVPSRAAFARDSHYPYSGTSWRNRTFVFNFQVYKSTKRTAEQN
ncbi:MAG: hypothetical protein Q4C75_03690 [Bergeyella zoohelcum]|nr:hypothetical protein [Bergeyella zoohelcum]